MVNIESLKSLDDDGLPTPEIGAWGEEKYRHVQLYASLFIKSMRTKWDATRLLGPICWFWTISNSWNKTDTLVRPLS